MSNTPRLKPTVRASGGTPAGFPDFRPINKLPEHELRALARRAVRPVLYQVWVEDLAARATIPVGPKCAQNTASALAFAIAEQVALGRERLWANPHLVPCLA